MSNVKQETIADIVAEMLEFADTDSQTIGRDVLRRRIQHFARRFEAVHKRDVTELEAKLCNTETAGKFFAIMLNSAKKQIAELRKCLKEAIDYNCAMCETKGKGCEVEGFCAEHRWRSVLEGERK